MLSHFSIIQWGLFLTYSCTLIDIPTSKLRKSNKINTIIIDSPNEVTTNLTQRNNSNDNDSENVSLLNILKPLAKSLSRHNEYYYNPPDDNDDTNSTKMFELPPTMPSVQNIIRKRLLRKLEHKFRLAHQHQVDLLGSYIKTLQSSPSSIKVHSFHKFRKNIDNTFDDTVLGFKAKKSPFFEIIEKKKRWKIIPHTGKQLSKSKPSERLYE